MDQASVILAYFQLAAALLEGGKTTIAKLREFLVAEGATPAQLLELDLRLSAAITRREAEGVKVEPANPTS